MADPEPGEIDPGSFSFRVSCYEQFHFTPDTISRLTLNEAEQLAIYFTEVGRYQWKERKAREREQGRATSHDGDGYGRDFEVVQVFGGDSFAEEDE